MARSPFKMDIPGNIIILWDMQRGYLTWLSRDTKFLFQCWKIFHEWVKWTSERFFPRQKRNFVSPSCYVIFLYKHEWNTKPFHFNSCLLWPCDLSCRHSNSNIFMREDNMLFSHVKISCFNTMGSICLIAQKLTWYFIGDYIINYDMLPSGCKRFFFFPISW